MGGVLPCRVRRRKRSLGNPSGNMSAPSSPLQSCCLPGITNTHISLYGRFSKDLHTESLIGNKQHSKTSAARVASRQARKADHLTKPAARTSQRSPSEPPNISDVNPHVRCDQVLHNPPQSISCCHLSSRQAGSAPQCCMGFIRTVDR